MRFKRLHRQCRRNLAALTATEAIRNCKQVRIIPCERTASVLIVVSATNIRVAVKQPNHFISLSTLVKD